MSFAPFSGVRPKYTDTDAVSDMVAVFDDLPKHLSTRLVYNGKQQEAQVWTMLLKQSICKRLSAWANAVVFEGFQPEFFFITIRITASALHTCPPRPTT